MSVEVGKIHYDLSLDKSKFDRASQDVLHNVSNLAKRFAVAMTVMAGAAVAFGVSSVKSFEESEAASKQLETVLKSTGGVAGVTADKANELARNLQKVTKYSDESVLGGENLLLTFTAIGKDIFPQATETMLDMSQALGQDVKSSAIQLGKALQDPILGVTALRRVGVNFSEKQQDVIKKLVETGKAAEAQALILKELQVEFGGSARAAGETFAGKMAILKNSFDDVKESIGQTIVTALIPLGARLSEFVSSDKFQAWLVKLQEWIGINLPIAINWVANTGIPAIKSVFETLYPVLKTALEIFISIFNFLKDNEWVVWGLVGAFVAVKTAMFLNGALVAFQGVMAGARLAIGLTSGALAGFQALLAIPMVMPAIVVVAALAAIAQVVRALKEAIGLSATASEVLRTTGTSGDARTAYGESLKRRFDAGEITAAERARLWKASALASGGVATGGKPYLVGERGPEMFIPRGTGTVKTANETSTMMGGSVSIYGNINIGSQQDSDNFFARLSRNQELSSKGLASMAGSVG